MKIQPGSSLIAPICCLCVLLGPTLTGRSSVAAESGIQWKAGDLAPAAKSSTTATRGRAAIEASVDRHVVIELNEIPDARSRADLARSGVHLLRYLGANAYFAKVTGLDKAPAGGFESIAAAYDIEPAWKLDPRILSGDLPPHASFKAVIENGRIVEKSSFDRQEGSTEDASHDELVDVAALIVLFHPDVDLATSGLNLLDQYGAMVRSTVVSINAAVIWLDAALIDTLAAEDEVQWIEPPLPPLRVNNNSNRAITQVDLVQAAPYNLTGSGITVLVYDGGYASASHPDFGGRLTVRDNSGLSDHATHVAGTIGGDGSNSGGLYRGMAPGVIMQSYGFQYDGSGTFLYTNPGDIESNYNQAINTYGAVIANNSIGTNVASNGFPCSYEGDYGATSQLIDSIVRGSLGAPMRIVWANGNERGPGTCGTTYHTTAPPACAKNHITVGALNSNNDSMTTFSSWGPTDDGRLKPDVSGPGCQSNDDYGVTSTIPGGLYGSYCGTSMASPTVCGIGALILQDFKVQFPGAPLPRNSTLKILLAHNAQDRGTTGPDYQYGYGSVRVKNTIDFLRSGSFAEEVIEQGENQVYQVYVAPQSSELKVTIAWDDPPGAVNTSPELVNDLDVVAISPSGGVTHYPWTLDPNNPASPAVRTQPDRRNNIEQVLVTGPQAGLWLIEVRGYSVPSGPQDYSIATTPDMLLCSSRGLVQFKRDAYTCGAQVEVILNDCDLNLNPAVAETATVTLYSTSEPTGEILLLTETATNSASFVGSMPVSTSNAVGVIQVAHGDLLTVEYADADTGTGEPGSDQDSADIDCVAPAISNVSVTNIGPVTATVTFQTDEIAVSTVSFGTSCGSLTGGADSFTPNTTHTIELSGLLQSTTYYFSVDALDMTGNLSTDDNGGACYSFTTLEAADYFTEQFTSGFDLDGRSLSLTPEDSYNGYTACIDGIPGLPTNPSGGTPLVLSDDGSAAVSLSGGQTVGLFGVSYGTIHVNANGNITFGSGDSQWNESLSSHFGRPRISVLWDDFNPPNGGTISYRQLSDRLAVTWQNVPQYGSSDSNTFQAELYFDGRITLSWYGVSTNDGIAGLSRGSGFPPDYIPSNLSGYGACGPPAPAGSPNPSDSEIGVDAFVQLVWTAGAGTLSHDVYFGLSSPGSFQGNQASNVFDPGPLALFTTYYWRVDEVGNGGTTVGDVWSFTTGGPDFDHDNDIDQADFGYFQACLSGTGIAQTDPECEPAFLDEDADIDHADLMIFLSCMNGANVPVTPGCGP